MAITLEAIRAAGGIVHSDGNIFFRDISMLQGLAGAAPAAVTPHGDYPQLPKHVTAYYDDVDHMEVRCFSESQMHAYFDLGRQPAAAPTLEAPAAPDSDLALIVAALEHGQPQMAHYAEPRERHALALAAARRMAAATQAPAAPADAMPYLQARLKDYKCQRVDNAGGTTGLTLYMTKLGAHPEYQLYLDEAMALWINIGRALGQPVAAAPAAPAVDAFTHAELLEIKRAVEEFADCNETDVDYALLLRAAQAGYLECTQFHVLNQSALDLDTVAAAQAKEGGA